MRVDVTITEREVAPPLLDASNHHALTWTRLVRTDARTTLSPTRRQWLLDTCSELIDRLAAEGDRLKLRALIAISSESATTSAEE